MTKLEQLNTLSRDILSEEFPDAKHLRAWESSEIGLILSANFLREISDSLARIAGHLISIEMNTRRMS